MPVSVSRDIVSTLQGVLVAGLILIGCNIIDYGWSLHSAFSGGVFFMLFGGVHLALAYRRRKTAAAAVRGASPPEEMSPQVRMAFIIIPVAAAAALAAFSWWQGSLENGLMKAAWLLMVTFGALAFSHIIRHRPKAGHNSLN